MSLSWDLRWAVEKGDGLEVERLLDDGVNVNERFLNGWTALHWAAWKGHKDVVETLVAAGADPNSKNEAKKKPADLAAVDILPVIRRGLLFNAAKRGDVAALTKVLVHCGVDEADKAGNGALHFATRSNHVEVVMQLVYSSANVSLTTKEGQTPLHYAARYGHVSVLDVLLGADANVDAKCKGGWTALHYGVDRGFGDVVDRLISSQANVNAKNDLGWTALHLAAKKGYSSVLDCLLTANADVNALNLTGNTALHKAAVGGHSMCVSTLLGAGVDVDAKELEKSWTALHLAAYRNHKVTVTKLVASGAAVNARQKDGRTALHYAALGGHLDIVSVLLSARAHVNAISQSGDTALHDAAQNGFDKVVEKLLEAGADIKMRNLNGRTPRQLAQSQEVRRILDLALLRQKQDMQVPVDRVKLFLCGNGEVGKSTLARALERGDWDAALRDLPRGKNTRTHGFDAFPATIPGAGNCTIWDFAGQTEFWVPHGIFMQTASGVFLVLCNLGDRVDRQLAQLRYWMRFIASRAQPEAKPRVALVGTHRGGAKELRAQLKARAAELTRAEHAALAARIQRLDQIKDSGGRWKSMAVEEAISQLHGEFADLLDLAPKLYYIDSVSLNRQDRAEMNKLRAWIGKMFDNVRATRPVPKVCLDVARLLQGCRASLPAVASFDEVHQAVQIAGGDKIDLSDEDRFRAVLGHLSKAGHVMYFEDVDDAVVVDPQAFGEHVIGQLFCPAGTEGFQVLVINKDENYLFRQSSLKEVLANTGVAPNGTPIVEDDPQFAVPGRLSHVSNSDGAVEEYHNRPRSCWAEPSRDTADRWHYLGVRLDITNSQLMIPPSSFPRLQSQLSKHSGFVMWRNGARTCNMTSTGLMELESLVELHDSLQWIDVCVRSGLGSEKKCMQLLLELVTMCERLGAQLRATIIGVDALKAFDAAVGDRRVDKAGAVQQSEDEARCQLPSQWLRERFAHVLNPPGPAVAKALPDSRGPGLHHLYFERPPPGEKVICISYSTKQRDAMWQVCNALAEAGYHVFNGDQIKCGEEWDAIYFNMYLTPCKVGIALLSDSYFESSNCEDELKTMYNEEKTIVPIKVAPYHNPPLRLKRMLGNHIPQVRGESADVFTDAFEANMRMLLQALEDVGAAKAT